MHHIQKVLEAFHYLGEFWFSFMFLTVADYFME